MTSPYTAVNEVRTTHTPGPWVVAGKDDQTGQINVMTDDGEYYVAGAISGFTSAGRQEANARLIAAAPELLKVAHMCADLAERWGDQGPLVQAARAAIASAESSS